MAIMQSESSTLIGRDPLRPDTVLELVNNCTCTYNVLMVALASLCHKGTQRGHFVLWGDVFMVWPRMSLCPPWNAAIFYIEDWRLSHISSIAERSSLAKYDEIAKCHSAFVCCLMLWLIWSTSLSLSRSVASILSHNWPDVWYSEIIQLDRTIGKLLNHDASIFFILSSLFLSRILVLNILPWSTACK